MTYQLKIDVSPVYELINSFLIYTTQKWINNLDVGSQWIEDVHQTIASKHHADFEAAKLLPFTDYDHLYALAITRHAEASIPEFLDFLSTQEATELADRISSLVPHVKLEDMIRIKEKYTPLLRVWYECYFTTVEDQYIPLLMEDAAEK